MATDAALQYLEPTKTPTSAQDPSAPILGHTDAETTGRTDPDGGPILRQRVSAPNTDSILAAIETLAAALAVESGGNLADVRAQLDKLTFTGSKLQVDAVLDGSEITIGSVNVLDTTDTEINPAREDGHLATVDSGIVAFKAANHTDLGVIATDVAQVDTDLLAFKAASHTDLTTVATDVTQVDTDLLAFKTANHADFAALATDVIQVDTDLKATQPRDVTDRSGRLLGHVTVDSLPALPAGTNDIGKVDQGTAGVSAWLVDASGHTVPVSAASLPLPAGAATDASLTNGNLRAGTASATVHVGQTTSGVAAVQLHAGSIPSTNGVLVQALAGNVASVFVGGSGVATSGASGGFELQAGQATPFTVADLNALYVIGSNGTDGVCWSVL